MMEPVGAEPDPKKGYVIIHKCTVCGAVRRNKAACAGKQGATEDDMKLIIALTGRHDKY